MKANLLLEELLKIPAEELKKMDVLLETADEISSLASIEIEANLEGNNSLYLIGDSVEEVEEDLDLLDEIDEVKIITSKYVNDDEEFQYRT